VASGFVDQCVACQALLQTLGETRIAVEGARTGGRADSPARSAAAFIEKIPELLRYPVTPSVLLTLVGLAVITTPLRWASSNNISGILGIIGFLIALGLEVSIYFHIVMRTAHGETEMEPPAFDNVFDDFFGPIGRYLAVLTPIIAGMFIWGEEQAGTWAAGVILFYKPAAMFDVPVAAALICAGIVLLPLLTAVAALSGSVLAVLNPALWIESLRVMAPTYPIAIVAYYAVFAFEYLFLHEFLLFDLAPAIPIPLFGSFVIMVIAYLPFALRARILGAMCEPYLGDFE
jgi:hypothetical protein